MPLSTVAMFLVEGRKKKGGLKRIGIERFQILPWGKLGRGRKTYYFINFIRQNAIMEILEFLNNRKNNKNLEKNK